MRILLLILALSLAPRAARAQTTVTSLADLRQVLKNGQTIVVTDASGQRFKGKLRDVSTSPPSLVILTPGPRTFPEGSIAEIRTTDSVLNGALIGGAIGTGLAVWDYLIDPSEPGNGPIFAVAIGLGTAIGAGIDALIDGRRVTIAPIGGRDRRGVQVSVRF